MQIRDWALLRHHVNTPSLILDVDMLRANIAIMAARCAAWNVALRPHAKSHKSSTIAGEQIAAGAIGISCATVDEAEAMAAAKIDSVLITSPVVTQEKMNRVLELARKGVTVLAVADHPKNVAAWNAVAEIQGAPIQLLVDVDVGHHRSGVVSVESAIELAEHIDASRWLEFAGIQGYHGTIQHISSYARRVEAANAVHALVGAVRERLKAIGLPPRIVTGGGTGSHAIDGQSGVFTELQAGSYIFMDCEYLQVEMEADGRSPFYPSLYVQTTVISANLSDCVQTDAGTKAFALNGPPPMVVRGAPADSIYSFLGDEHGRLAVSVGSARPSIGDRIECLTPHCDPTVHLYHHYDCVRGDHVIDRWPIDARDRK